MNSNFMRCDGCGVEITWAPLVVYPANTRQMLHYCCQECLAGGECGCAERLELEDRRSAPAETPPAWSG